MAEQINFDNDQIEAVKKLENAVVSAGAGSGKTRVLSSRFAYLVKEKNYPVESILTLTFTKKATIEMYGRIYETLYEENPDLVKDFHKANIKTLDSYCSYVAKQGAHFYGISPSFTVDKDAINQTISNMALPFILKNKDNQAIKFLVNTKNYEDVANQLFVTPMIEYSTVASPLDFYGEYAKQMKETILQWKNVCNQAEDTVYNLRQDFEAYEGNKKTKFYENLSKALEEDLPEIPVIDESNFKNGDTESMVDFIKSVQNVSSIKFQGVRNADDIKEQVYNLQSLCKTMISILNFVHGGKLTNTLLPLMEEFQTLANNAKRQSSTLSYADVSSLALRTLREHKEIRHAEKQKYNAIMIDEFQDNNEMQKELLFLLAEKENQESDTIPTVEELCPNKLFFVGDEKQSIYRFRGADVSVFRRLSKDFEKGNMMLGTNYRSIPTLIAGFNTIFGGEPYPPELRESEKKLPGVFLTQENEDTPVYEAVYKNTNNSKANCEMLEKLREDSESYKEYYKPKIHIALYDKNQEAIAGQLIKGDAEANWVVNKIKTLVENGVSPNEIAILFRTYASQPLYEKLLLQKKIPYSTETVTGFFNSHVVTDIYSFLRICAYPADKLAFENVLKSSFINLTKDEANCVLSQCSTAFEKDGSEFLQGKSLERYRWAREEIFQKVFEESKDCPITKLVNDLWYKFGYRYETMWNTSAKMYESLYDRIFELARLADSTSSSLADFVDSMRTYEDESKKLENMDIPMEQNDGVHLMTIFKSKGLEFNYVFVCDCNHGTKNQNNSESIYYSKEFGLTVNTPPHPDFDSKSNYFFDLVKNENYKMASAELRRLTYVAITRAVKEVFISGVTTNISDITQPKEIDDSTVCPYAPNGEKDAKSILQTLLPSLEFFVPKIEEEKKAVRESEKEKTNSFDDDIEIKKIFPYTFVKILPADFKEEDLFKGKAEAIQSMENQFENAIVTSKENVSNRHTSPSKLYTEEETKAQNEKDNPYFEIDNIISKQKNSEVSFTYTDFGTIAHAFMEAAVNNEKAKISNKNIVGLEGSKKNLDTVLKICEDMAQKFLDSSIGGQALKSCWHKTEYAFRYSLSDIIISGSIDLVYENDDGSFTIVDYKTNREMNGEIYAKQLACYREAICQMKGVEKENVKCVLYYLRYSKSLDITQLCDGVNLSEAVASLELK